MKSFHPKEYSTPSEIPDEWFRRKKKHKGEAEIVTRPSLSYWKDAGSRLKKNKLALLGLLFLILLTIMAIIVPILSPCEVNKLSLQVHYEIPADRLWFDTDSG